jgi:RNase H-fold protein (predicted Holliday junction resolvase)
MAKKAYQNNPKVLGLDVSTKTIGWALFDMRTQELLELTHISPRPKMKTENKIKMHFFICSKVIAFLISLPNTGLLIIIVL